MISIVLDAMGSDTHPAPEIDACLQSKALWGDPVTLVGPAEVLLPQLDARNVDSSMVTLVDAPDVLEMADHAAEAARGKARSSMAVGMELLKNSQAQAFVTAGNTGGAMANALFRLGRIRGVRRPGLAGIIPVQGGRAVLIDMGANADCRPDYLQQFAVFGSLYAERVLGIENPRIGLISNGEEPGKGSTLVRETYPLLEECGLNFVGNIEAKEFYRGQVDVAVTDGFAGNVFLKASEAVASFLIGLLRQEIKAGLVTSVGGQLARPAFRRVARVLDPSEYGAAPLLGVDGLVFVGHGRSDAKALVNAIRVARQAVSAELLTAMREAIQSRFARGGEVEPP